jgi:addiction module RelB/DinJ family antitoxin
MTKVVLKTPPKTKSQLIVPLDTDLKLKVKNILEELGLNQSQVIVSFFKEIARTNKVPLSFDLNDSDETNYIRSDKSTYDTLLKYKEFLPKESKSKVFDSIEDLENFSK